MLFKNKRAQGIPMETVIIAIIVIVVLVVIIAFFVGGTSTITQRMKQIFTGSTAGTDKPQAVQFCQQYCDLLIQADIDGTMSDPYCTKYFYIDTTGSGSPDRVKPTDSKSAYKKWYCNPTSQQKLGNKDSNGQDDNLNVGCNKVCNI